jgi:hypothetical protein
MEQTEFLASKVFTNLTNLNDGFDKATNLHFSETDFETIIERAEYFGIGIYTIEGWLDGVYYDAANHEDFNKKATDPLWYKKALKTMSMRQPGLSYTATYKVSKKLLARKD